MEIRLLKPDYLKSDNLYEDFQHNRISEEEHFSGETVIIEAAPDFPIYINERDDSRRIELYLEAFRIIEESYLELDRDINMNGDFWHSLLLTHKRDFILESYPETAEDESKFRNVVMKRFDWENYIYKCILGAQYVTDHIEDHDEKQEAYRLIATNLDLYNYIIKYEIFRNGPFLLNVLKLVNKHNISELLKAKIKGREDLGEDERIGRRVIFELNKSYPILMAPILSLEELEPHFMKYLRMYQET